jgi:hypothetical protein
MATNDVEVRPYGTQSQTGSLSTSSTTPVQRNEVEVRPSGARVDAQVFVAQGEGRRTDVDVKPYSLNSEEQFYKPQQQYQYSQTTRQTTRPLDMDTLKNPLVATALGITLALLLLSLSHLPKMVGGWFGHHDKDYSVARRDYDVYDRPYGPNSHAFGRQDSHLYENARDSVYHAKDRAEDLYYHAKDAIPTKEGLFNRARHAVMGSRYQQPSRYQQEEHHESFLERARNAIPFRGRNRHIEEEEEDRSMYQRARDMLPHQQQQRAREAETLVQRARNAVGMGGGDSYNSGGSYVDEARHAACRTAERARDIACDFSSGSSGPGLMERGREYLDSARYQARDAAENAKYQARDAMYQARDAQDTVASRAQSYYEQAKARAADVLDTVTYPIRATQDTVERAKETVVGSAGSSMQAAKDAAYNTKETVKNVAGDAIHGVKDTVAGVKDTVVGAGQAVKDKLTPSGNNDADITINGQGNGQHRGPTKVKVEVQEL